MTNTGRCECGGVRYRTTGPLRPVLACHCDQCRRTSGHYWATTQVDAERLELVSAETLRWYRSSADAERGFCDRCGGSLFWRVDGTGKVSIGAGTLDKPTGLSISAHIFTEDKGDYYTLPEEA